LSTTWALIIAVVFGTLDPERIGMSSRKLQSDPKKLEKSNKRIGIKSMAFGSLDLGLKNS
jgi:hypothetical protein